MKIGESDNRFCPNCGSVKSTRLGMGSRYECGVFIRGECRPTNQCIINLKTDIQFWKSLLMDGVENPYKENA